MDPKFNNKAWLLMEIVVRVCYFGQEPIHVGAVFLFKRQTDCTFERIIKILINHNREFERVAFVDTDGCRRLGGAIERNFSLCEHGADPGHTLANIIRKAEEVGGKSKKWGTRIRADMKSVWDQPDSYASSVELMRVCETYPAALKTYIMINKSEIMLTVLSRAGRRAAGRIRSDGSDQSGDTQSAESAHAVIDRVMGNKKHDAAALIDASLELFKYQFTQHVHGRMGRLHMYTLKKETVTWCWIRWRTKMATNKHL